MEGTEGVVVTLIVGTVRGAVSEYRELDARDADRRDASWVGSCPTSRVDGGFKCRDDEGGGCGGYFELSRVDEALDRDRRTCPPGKLDAGGSDEGVAALTEVYVKALVVRRLIGAGLTVLELTVLLDSAVASRMVEHALLAAVRSR